MYCNNCGTFIHDGVKFCPNCGACVTASQPGPDCGASQYTAPSYNYNSGGNSSPVLVWGILGLAFACSFWLSFLGIIFSAIAKGKANNYFATYGYDSKKATVGQKLATAGLIVGIILTALSFFTLVLLVAVA